MSGTSRTKPKARLIKTVSSGGEYLASLSQDPSPVNKPPLNSISSVPLHSSSSEPSPQQQLGDDENGDAPIRSGGAGSGINTGNGSGFFGRILKSGQAQKKKSPEPKRSSAVIRGADDASRSRADSKHSRSRSSHAHHISGFHAFSLDDQKQPEPRSLAMTMGATAASKHPSAGHSVSFVGVGDRSTSFERTNTNDNDELSASYSLVEKGSNEMSGLGGVSNALGILTSLIEEEKDCFLHYPRVKERVLNAILSLKQLREEHRVGELEKSLLFNVFDSSQNPENPVTKWISSDFAPTMSGDFRKTNKGSTVIRSYSTPVVDSDTLQEKLQSSAPAAEGGSKMRTRANSMEKILESRLNRKLFDFL
eukprot:TRINITY_DN10301_c0_g1_i1.p1 TRINITY_DN10301_c0_g1~~TRINITY_DN10301_c0_g1_i1.p1  ORF type:complete len:365 (+),score=68.85 TRINITY_DN10301_c0_g1_i1:76-1170(+)